MTLQEEISELKNAIEVMKKEFVKELNALKEIIRAKQDWMNGKHEKNKKGGINYGRKKD